ncbi:MAG: YHS domain-containing protein [Phycisphaerae bacterium]
MNRFAKQVFIGSGFALGVALAPAMAQHDGHGHGRGDAQHGEKASSPAALPTCPVTDEPANLAISAATDEGPVFFCCKDCMSKYRANKAKYAGKVAEQRRVLARRPGVQVTCPVSKEPVDQEVFLERNGQKVYFCCKGCINKYQADPAKYASALANSYTHQTKCPVTGEDIDPQAFTTVASGMSIYFCCQGCEKKLFTDPQKHAPRLVAQGFTIDAKEMVHDADEEAGHDHDSHGHGGHDHDH